MVSTGLDGFPARYGESVRLRSLFRLFNTIRTKPTHKLGGTSSIRLRTVKSPFNPRHQIPAAPVFSFTYELPSFYLLCFDIHAGNGV